MMAGGRERQRNRERHVCFGLREEKQTITGEYISFELVIQWTSSAV